MRTVKDARGNEFAPTNILIPIDVHQRARELKINMSEICSVALSDRVNAIEAQAAL